MFVSKQDYAKTTQPIFTNFGGQGRSDQISVIIQMWIWIQEFFDGIFITLDHGHAPDGLLVFNKFNLHVHVPAVVPRDTNILRIMVTRL